MYELGLAHALKKDVILLAQRQDEIPFDLKVYRHILYDTSDNGRVILRRNLAGYLTDLFFRGPDNFGKVIKDDDFVLLFLSNGGTCRCAMSNVITRYLLASTKTQESIEEGPPNLKPMSAALSDMSRPQMSDLAQSVVLKQLGVDGSRHRTLKCTIPLLERADVLLPMATGLAKGILEKYSDKTYLFKAFFGQNGDIEDPWGGTEQKYIVCFNQLHSILAANTDRLKALSSERIKKLTGGVPQMRGATAIQSGDQSKESAPRGKKRQSKSPSSILAIVAAAW